MRALISVFSAFLFFACTTDSYNKGEGRSSLLQANTAELTVNSEKEGVSFVTDDGDAYMLTKPLTAHWIQTADTVYRAIIYYKEVADGMAAAQTVAQLTTIHPVPHWMFKQLPQDPLDMESCWLSKGGKYLNMALLVKSGYVDDKEEKQTIGLAQDTVLLHASQKRTACYRLLHRQNDVPQYFTSRRYVCIALPAGQLDTVRLAYPTLGGTVERTLVLK